MNRPSRRTAVLLMTTAALSLSILSGSGCGRKQEITRVDPEAVADLDYRFNDSDAREVYKAMVNDALYRKWIDNWMSEHAGKKPIVVVGPIRNETQEYVVTSSFTTQFERELLNSDRVRFVAMKDQRNDIRDERQQGQEWNTPETVKQMRAELGADLILIGKVTDNKQRALDGRSMVNSYMVTHELINLESNEKMWIGVHEIKKIVTEK